MLILAVAATAGTAVAKDKVLFVDSYHAGYAWSDGILEGMETVFGDEVDLKVVHMDTKRNPSDEAKQEGADKAAAVIESWKPDVVIASDDNAAKFLIEPLCKKMDVPFVFCGLNWDASGYDFTSGTVCGMEEVSLVPQLMKELKAFGKTDKVGFLGPDITTARKEAENVGTKFDLNLTTYFAKDFDDWKKGYKELQDNCDVIIIDSDGGLYADHADEMKDFAMKNAKKPTGACYDFMAPYAMLSYAKVAQEQGEWAASAALRILDGEKPSDIGVTQNKRGTIYVNVPMASQIGAEVPIELIETAEIVD